MSAVIGLWVTIYLVGTKSEINLHYATLYGRCVIMCVTCMCMCRDKFIKLSWLKRNGEWNECGIPFFFLLSGSRRLTGSRVHLDLMWILHYFEKEEDKTPIPTKTMNNNMNREPKNCLWVIKRKSIQMGSPIFLRMVNELAQTHFVMNKSIFFSWNF